MDCPEKLRGKGPLRLNSFSPGVLKGLGARDRTAHNKLLHDNEIYQSRSQLSRSPLADGAIVYRQACALGCEGIVSKRLGSPYRSGRADCWVKVKNPAAPAVRREAEEDWG